MTCGGPPVHADSFDAEPGAELEDHPSASALRAALKNPVVQPPQPTHWWLMARDDEIAYYVSEMDPELYYYINIEKAPDGWTLGGYGDCTIHPDYSLTLVEWKLDPAYPRPTPASTRIHVILTRVVCGDETPADSDRLLEPAIVYSVTRVYVGFAELPSDDPHDAPSRPTKAVIRLREPLGDRQMYGTYAVTCGAGG